MDPFWTAFACLWTVALVVGVVRWASSPSARRLSEAIGTPPIVTTMVALSAAVGAWIAAVHPHHPRYNDIAVLAHIPLFVDGLWLRHQWRKRDDLPPYIKEVVALPLNPFVILRHPVRWWKLHWRVHAHPVRSMRETRKWMERRGDS